MASDHMRAPIPTRHSTQNKRGAARYHNDTPHSRKSTHHLEQLVALVQMRHHDSLSFWNRPIGTCRRRVRGEADTEKDRGGLSDGGVGRPD